MNEPVFCLSDVVRRFPQGRSSLEVLRGVSLDVAPGELIALVGPSGAGKSTLLHIAGLLERPDAGEVRLAGAACSRLNDHERTMIRRVEMGFVYQYHHLLPEFSAEENVTLPQLIAGRNKATARQRSQALLEQLGLAARLQHRPGQLSGGEQQRVAIARALANTPRLLLADEPTGNLDPRTAAEVFDMLLGLARSANLAGVIATHNPQLAARMDRTVELREGQLLPV